MRLFAVIFLLLGSCISQVSLDNAPCPCGEGYRCCITLGICLPDGKPCPSSYPPSSEKQCVVDSDCAAQEACHSWTVDGPMAGPRECRQKCKPNIPCSTGESCMLAPHDGKPLSSYHAISLCANDPGPPPSDMGTVDQKADDGGQAHSSDDSMIGNDLGSIPDTGCQNWSCKGCPIDQIGRTFCADNNLYGCLVSTHPACGYSCKKLLVEKCSECKEEPTGISCSPAHIVQPPDPCENYSCTACPKEKTTYCDGKTIKTCLQTTYNGQSCKELCLPLELKQCQTACTDSTKGLAYCSK